MAGLFDDVLGDGNRQSAPGLFDDVLRSKIQRPDVGQSEPKPPTRDPLPPAADGYNGPIMTAAPVSRTFGEFVSDQRHAAGEGVASAVGGLIEAPVGLVNAAVAYSPLRMAIEKLSPSTGVGIQKALHIEQPGIVKKAAGVFHDIAEAQRGKMSTDHQIQAEQLNEIDGAWNTAKFLATNPAYTATEATKVFAQMVPGGVLAKGATTAGALARGAQSALAGERAATAFNVGSQAAMAGSLQGNEVRATLEAMPMEKLKAQPEFGQLKAALETDSDEDVRDWLIKNAESNAFAESFAINAVTPFLIPHGATIEKAMLGQGAAGASRWRNALLGGAGEAAEEGIAESGEQISQNVRTFRPWDEGVGKAGALGAVLGAGMGVPAGALQAPSDGNTNERLDRVLSRDPTDITAAIQAGTIKRLREDVASAPTPETRAYAEQNLADYLAQTGNKARPAIINPATGQTSQKPNGVTDAAATGTPVRPQIPFPGAKPSTASDAVNALATTQPGSGDLSAVVQTLAPANAAPKRRQIAADEVTRRAQAKLAELDAWAAGEGGLTDAEAELQTVLRRNMGNPAMLANMLGADLAEPSAQDQAQVPEPQPEEAPPRAVPPAQNGIVAPLTPSWVNQETGEVSIPGREDMRAALESQMQAQFAAHGNTAVDADAIAYAWQASGVDVSPTAITKVARDVRKGFTPATAAPTAESAGAPEVASAQSPEVAAPEPVRPAVPFPDAAPDSIAAAPDGPLPQNADEQRAGMPPIVAPDADLAAPDETQDEPATPSEPATPEAVEPDAQVAPPGIKTAIHLKHYQRDVSPSDLVKTKDVNGKTVFVHKDALADESATQLPMYTSRGTQYRAKDRHQTIHRENLDLDGSKRAAGPGLPYYAITTRTGEKPFKTARAAKKAVTDDGQNLDDYEITAHGAGFVAIRKSDADQKAAQPAQSSAEPAAPVVGDRVNITGGAHKGKSGSVTSLGKNYGITFDDGSTGRVGPKAVQKAVSTPRETVDPANDPIVGEDIHGSPIRKSKAGTYYTVEHGRVRTGPPFKEGTHADILDDEAGQEVATSSEGGGKANPATPTYRIEDNSAAKRGEFAVVGEDGRAVALFERSRDGTPKNIRYIDKSARAAVDGVLGIATQGTPTKNTNLSFNEQYDERVKESKDAGNVHLDQLDASVEGMRGRRIHSVHDPKVRGVVRTVDNSGNVWIYWSDDYSAKKEMATPSQEGKKTVFRSILGPRDLKDYVVEGVGDAATHADIVDDDAATHADAGERPEPATPAVIAEAAATAASHPNVTMAEARAHAADRPAIEAALRPADVATDAGNASTSEPSRSESDETSAGADRFANNKMFTSDKVAAAKARLKAKLGQLNSGVDPELFVDGVTIAGAYIESGVRKFADYAKAMVDDLGDAIKPYLLSFYEGVRYYPGVDTKGMDSAADAQREFDALLTPADLQADAIGNAKPPRKTRAKATTDRGARTLRDDWGVDHINGYSNTSSREKGNDTKDAFLKDASAYLKAVAEALEDQGYTVTLDRKGKPAKAVSVNESGMDGSGDVYLHMVAPDGTGIYVHVGDTTLRGAVPSTTSGIALMYRTTNGTQGKSGANQWGRADLTAAELAAELASHVQRHPWVDASNKGTLPVRVPVNVIGRDGLTDAVPAAGKAPLSVAPTTEKAHNPAQEAVDAPDQANRQSGQPPLVSGGRAREDGSDAAAGAANRGSVDAGVAEAGEGAAGAGDLFAGASGAGRDGSQGAVRISRDDASGEARDRGTVRAEPGTADAVEDFDLTGEALGKGGLATKYRENVAAIRIVKTLEAEGRVATPEERKQLARYVGWGALKGVFDQNNKQWAKQHAELKELLTSDEYAAARASTRNAHFTSQEVVAPMIDGLQRLGFTKGRLLEPSVGTGNFFGMMPARLRQSAELFGVELDPITSKIAAGLYPSARITNSGFEDYQVPGGFFDAAIGNPPFGEEPIADSDRSPYSGFSIHNYFIAKTIDKLRPGGVAMMVVSHNFLDARDNRARKWIAERASLVAAVRLPDTAFKGNAGTEVVTDVLVFQKHQNGIPNGERAWVDSGRQKLENPKTGESSEHNVSQYFLAHPENVLGEPTAGGSMYRANDYTVKASGDLATQLTEWVNRLPEGIYQPIDRTESMQKAEVPDGIKVGSYYVDGKGVIQQRGEDTAGAKTADAWTPPNAKAEARMRGMIAVRDALRAQMLLERDPLATDKAIAASRNRLNKAYDNFLKEHGYLNSPTNYRLFKEDSDSDLVQALEFDYDNGISKAVADREGIEPRAASARKADIFERRVAFPQNDMQAVFSAKDALIASLNYRGTVDPAYMARVYGKDQDAIVAELGDLVYSTPEGGIETADAYLSGDVKTKLAEAEAAAKADSAFTRNVKALKAVIPKDKSPSEIHISLGAHFVPSSIVEDFIEHITGAKVSTSYVKSLGRWMFNKTGHIDEVRNAQTWGTPHIGADKIIQQTIDGRTVVVTKTEKVGDSTRTIVLEAETEAAREKQNAIRNEWKSWLWRDPERGEKVLAEYNDKMNRTVRRSYDGSHLSLPGKNPAITLLKHQLDGIWRGLQSRQILLDHVVGAGKTFQIVGMIMEMRRLGIARKPVLAVPNHLTLQWRSEFTRLYPGARVLAARPEDFSKENRPKLFSKIVTGDWDAVILGHSSLKKIGLPSEVEANILKEQIDDLAKAIEEIKRERGDRNIVRDMEGIKRNLEAKMKERLSAAGPRDKVLTFDELGLDALGVDELHEFKNLTYSSTMTKVPGMGNPKGSARAFDLFMKTQWLFKTYGDQAPLITATGTPVSNSLVEMYNVQRYMQYPQMKRDGLHMFDAWARAYGSVENVYEVAPSGSGFRASSRFAKFQNLSSLMADYLSFADVITLDDLKVQEEARGGRFPVPKVKGGRPQLVVAPRSPLVADFMGVPKLSRWPDGGAKFKLDLAHGDTFETEDMDGKVFLRMHKAGDDTQAIALGTYENAEEARAGAVEAALTPEIDLDEKSVLGRFARVRELTRETKGKVNALSLTGEANKAGLDYRLINPNAPDFPDSKINRAVDNIVAEYKAWKKDKGTQLVFCDMSVPISARAALANKPKRAYVRDTDGSVIHRRATLHSLEGAEELPFLIVEARAKTKDRPAAFAVYDAATGHLMADDQPSRAAAKEWAESALAGADARARWVKDREASGELQQEEIDEYNDANEIDTAEVEAVTLQDIAGVSASAGFSVYDDMRAKLIKNGIPEREIAFIHDYSTPSAKAKLFAAVNRGDVRVLFGSTPKMGAGTNVQERAVALHHIDAPWKPSDLEQREGRVIRRGNKLYDRDPEGFEVGIYRYATAQTYDARRWQILEHKARGIEQLRTFDGTINEIDDIDGEASNAADMKAAASGDPLILRETQLRNDVKRLENLEAAHADNVVAARRAAQRSKEDAEKYLPRKLKTIETMLAERLPDTKEGVPTGSAVGGKKISDRKEFTQAIARAVGEIARDVVLGRNPDDLTIKWRGLSFEVTAGVFGSVHVGNDLGDILSFVAKEADSFSASGLITRMNNAVDRLDAQKTSLTEQIEEARTKAERFIEEAAKPFADAENLASARRDFKSVQRLLLMKGPDLQAADKKTLDAGLETQREALRKAGLGDALDEMLAARRGSEGMFSRSEPVTNRAMRMHGLPAPAGEPQFLFRNDQPLKRHPAYAAAKSGDQAAAVELVRDLAEPLRAVAEKHGSGVIYLAPHAEEASGRNKIPNTLAAYLASVVGAQADTEIVQTNRAFHTGAQAMQRLIAPSEFAGEVVRGGRYVLVDDVTTMGGTLADLAGYIQANGGQVVGSVVMTNAVRGGKMLATASQLRTLERRFGDEIRTTLNIEPAALTAAEAGYLIGFRTADELRNRAASARQERIDRLRAKGVRLVTKSDSNATANQPTPPSAGSSRFGERFSFAGQRAETADTMALATAQARIEAGDDAEAVRRETGWHKGADGKWRFEINDRDAKLKNLRVEDGEGRRATWLSNILDHPALFAAYPALADVDVQLDIVPGSAERGSYKAATKGDDLWLPNPALIRVEAPNETTALSVLLHEIQHGIQHIEGFARGGNPGTMSFNPQGRRALQDLDVLRDLRKTPEKPLSVFQEELEALGFDYSVSYLRWLRDVADEAGLKGFAASGRTPYEQYRHLAGEAEARNTEARWKMTDAERRATSPTATQDVADADVIVTFNGTVMEKAPAPANIQAQARPQSGTLTTVEDAQAAVRQVLDTWKGDKPVVRVVRSLAEARAMGARVPENAPADVEGWWDGGSAVYLFTDNLRDVPRVLEVLAHEAVGHYGIEQVMGEGDWKVLVADVQRLAGRPPAQLSPKLQKVMRSAKARYGNESPEVFAREFLAIMAEQGVKNSMTGRVLAAVRRFLQRLGIDLKTVRGFREAALLDALYRGRQRVTQGAAGQRQGAARPARAMAFAKPDTAPEMPSGVGVLSAQELDVLRQLGLLSQEQEADLSGREQGNRDERPINEWGERITTEQDKAAYLRLWGRPYGELPDGASPESSAAVGAESRPLERVVRRLSESATRELGGVHDAARDFSVRLGPFSGYQTRARVKNQGMPQEALVVEVFGKEQVEAGVNEEPALTWTIHVGTGEMDVNGPNPDRATFRAFHKRGWADHARGQDGEVAAGWTALRNPDGSASLPMGQILPMLADVHARYRALRKEDRVGLHWSRITGATGGMAGREAAVFFSRPDPTPSNPTGSPLVGNEPAIVSNFEKLLRPGKAVVQAAKNLLEQFRPVWLGAFTLDQLVELAGKRLPQIKHYADILQELDVDRNVMQEEAGTFADEWQKWAAKHREDSIALNDLMHEATIAGTDPAKDFAPLPIMFGGQKLEANKENVKQVLLAIREQMRGRAGDSKREMLARAKEVRGLIKRNARREKDHKTLQEQWQALSPEAQAMYRRARDMYAKRRDQREAALKQRIRDMDMDDRRKQATIAKIQAMFEAQRVQAPYFPLQRQGDFWISAESPEGEPTYIMREKVGEWQKEIDALKAAGFKIKATGRKGEKARLLEGASAKFITEVIQHLQKTGAPIQAQDDIYQMYLQSLPEMSQRKHSIHRKAVSGYGQDAIRNFASNMLHEAHQIARLKYSHKLEGFVNLAEKHNNAVRKHGDADPKQIAAADAMLSELKKRHEWIMNPSNSRAASTATSLGFVYYLGLTPAAALVNLTQVVQTTLPHLSAHPDIGLAKASTLLTSAMKDALRTGGNIGKTLTKPEERRAYRMLVDRGALDKSLAHNLAGLSGGDSTKYNPAYAKTMEIISFMFHKVEVVNREATGMAAFRAMRLAGKSFDEAVQFATDAIWKTHFNYGNSNRPRWMQSDTAKVLFLFKQYSQNMTWFLGRNAYQALKGETKAVRRQALKTLAGTLGMTGIMAGAMGMPLLPIVFTVLNAVAASFGDDDDYFDAETELRNFLADVLGQRGGRIVTEGVVNELTGANIAGRVGLSDLWVREPNRELEGRDSFAYYLEQLAGPVFGMGKNLFVGKQLMDEGHLMRGWETILPKAFSDGLKAFRFGTEGVNTLRGDPVIEGVSPWQLATQASGFSLAEASAQYEANNAAMKFETHVIGRRQALMDAYAMALRMNDLQAHAKVLDGIRRFNAKYPELGIKASTLRNSLRARQRYSDRSQGGVALNPNLAARSREQARFGASP